MSMWWKRKRKMTCQAAITFAQVGDEITVSVITSDPDSVVTRLAKTTADYLDALAKAPADSPAEGGTSQPNGTG